MAPPVAKNRTAQGKLLRHPVAFQEYVEAIIRYARLQAKQWRTVEPELTVIGANNALRLARCAKWSWQAG